MRDKYIYLEQGDHVPDHDVMLVLRFTRMDNGTATVQCQTTSELNAWTTILTLFENGEVRVAEVLPHGLFQSNLEERHE